MKTISYYLLITAISVLSVLSSCSKKSDTPAPGGNKDVYVMGYVGNVATVWKNGVAASVSDGKLFPYVNAGFVSGNDVYVAGSQYAGPNPYGGSNYVPTLWKNGIKMPYDTVGDPFGKYLWVSGNDVYQGGVAQVGAYGQITVWKNGKATPVNDGKNPCSFIALYVSGGDEYVLGEEHNGSTGLDRVTLWKNSVAVSSFNRNSGFFPNMLYVSGGDVFLAQTGVGSTTTKIYKNGTATSLVDASAYITSIYEGKKGVYVTGVKSYGQYEWATVWKNGVAGPALTKGMVNSYAYSICESGGDVYVAGMEGNNTGTGGVAKLWKNGIATDLGGGGSIGANALTVIAADKP